MVKWYFGKRVFSSPEKEYGLIGCKKDKGVYNLLAFSDDELYVISVIADEDVDEYEILETGWEEYQIHRLVPDDIYYFFGGD